MNRLPEKLEEVRRLLAGLDRSGRIQMLIDLAGTFTPVPPRIATRPYPPTHRVPGCESETYIWSEPGPDGTLCFHFAVENPQGISARALAAILQRTLSGAPLEAVAEVPPDLIYDLFGAELSMGKSLGLMGMVNMVRAMARRRLAIAAPAGAGAVADGARNGEE